MNKLSNLNKITQSQKTKIASVVFFPLLSLMQKASAFLSSVFEKKFVPKIEEFNANLRKYEFVL